MSTRHLTRAAGLWLGRTFFDEPTVRTLARIVLDCQARQLEGEARQDARQTEGIFTFEAAGTTGDHELEPAVPVFCFPGWRGRDGGPVDPHYLRHVARNLGDRHPLCVVTAAIPPFHETPRPVEELARTSIQAIRGVQAHGAYVLSGHCLGAVVAFEAARQLLLEGETVSQILFFDAVTPGYPKIAANWSNYRTQTFRIVRELDWRAALEHGSSLVRALNRRISGQLRRKSARFPLGAAVNAKILTNRSAVALWQYTLRPCTVPIIHFIAADQPVSKVLDDPRYGWREVAEGGIEFRSVAGDHDSMMSMRNAPGLADTIRSSIAKPPLAVSSK